MQKKREVIGVAWCGTFAEAEEREIARYAALSWVDSAQEVCNLRQSFWPDTFNSRVEPLARRSRLSDDRDDFE